MTQHASEIVCIPQQQSLSIGQRFKSLITLAFVVALVAGAWKYGPAIRSQVRLLYWQRQCMNLSMDADWVAYEEDATAAKELARATGADRKGSWSESDFFTITDGASNKLLGCYMIPRCATEMQARVNGAGSCGPVLFLHSLRPREGGRERLVQVELSLIGRTMRKTIDSKNYADDQVLKITVMQPAGIVGSAKVLSTKGWWHRGISEQPFGKLRFFAGQIDQADPSHFTIVYHDAIAHGTLDGNLQADDTVQIGVRDVLKLP